jgi:hypothetical protein
VLPAKIESGLARQNSDDSSERYFVPDRDLFHSQAIANLLFVQFAHRVFVQFALFAIDISTTEVVRTHG